MTAFNTNRDVIAESRHEPPSPASPSRPERIRLLTDAQADASQCGICGFPLPSGTAIVKVTVCLGRSMFGGNLRRLAPCCSACAPLWAKRRNGRPCVSCGRTVIEQYESTTAYCSLRCQQAWRRATRIAAKPQRLPVVCAQCSKPFEPKRKDAVVCSAACRQRAYRHRREGLGQEPSFDANTPTGRIDMYCRHCACWWHRYDSHCIERDKCAICESVLDVRPITGPSQLLRPGMYAQW